MNNLLKSRDKLESKLSDKPSVVCIPILSSYCNGQQVAMTSLTAVYVPPCRGDPSLEESRAYLAPLVLPIHYNRNIIA